MKITVTQKKEIEFEEQEVRKSFSSYMQKCLERQEKVLKDDYLNWLAEFVMREETFDDEANRVAYCGKYTQEEQEKIHLVSVLFSLISRYYDKHDIEHDVQKSHFYNQAVTVNITDDVSIEMRIWCGQGAVTDVSLIETKTGKVDIKDVITEYFKK